MVVQGLGLFGGVAFRAPDLGLGFGVRGLGFGVWGLVFGVWCVVFGGWSYLVGIGVWVQGLGAHLVLVKQLRDLDFLMLLLLHRLKKNRVWG